MKLNDCVGENAWVRPSMRDLAKEEIVLRNAKVKTKTRKELSYFFADVSFRYNTHRVC